MEGAWFWKAPIARLHVYSAEDSNDLRKGVGQKVRAPLLGGTPSLSAPHAAMSFPHEDYSHPNSIEEVRDFLDSRHPAQYLVFNLSGHSYDTTKLNNQVSYIHVHVWV